MEVIKPPLHFQAMKRTHVTVHLEKKARRCTTNEQQPKPSCLCDAPLNTSPNSKSGIACATRLEDTEGKGTGFTQINLQTEKVFRQLFLIPLGINPGSKRIVSTKLGYRA